MCTVLDQIENKGREEGRLEGRQEGRLEGMTQIYYTELHYSADQIAKKLDAPVDEVQELIDRILKK